MLALLSNTALANESDAPTSPDTETSLCTKTEDCSAETHEDGCPKYKDTSTPTKPTSYTESTEPEESTKSSDSTDPTAPEIPTAPAAQQNTLLTQSAGNVPLPANNTPVNNEQAFLAAMTAGGSVTLGGSFSLSSNITLSKDVTLDLNGHTLNTGTYSLTINGGNLTIQDSSVPSAGKITGTDYLIDMKGSNTVTLVSGSLEGTGWSAVVRIGSGNTFKMTGGTAKQTQRRYRQHSGCGAR